MRSVAPHDRPREKLERVGAGGLGDNELLAIVLGHGVPRTSALELANAVLDAVGGLHGLARASHRRPAPRAGHRHRAGVAADRGGRSGPPDAGPRRAASASQIKSRARRRRAAGAGVRLAAGRAVRRPAARHQTSRPADHAAVGRHARRQHRPSARGLPRGRVGRRRGDRGRSTTTRRATRRRASDDIALTRRLVTRGRADGDHRPRSRDRGGERLFQHEGTGQFEIGNLSELD